MHEMHTRKREKMRIVLNVCSELNIFLLSVIKVRATHICINTNRPSLLSCCAFEWSSSSCKVQYKSMNALKINDLNKKLNIGLESKQFLCD